MKRALTFIVLAFLISCGERQPSHSLGGLGLVKVYVVEDHGEMNCESLLGTLKVDKEIPGSLQSQTLSDFEVDGFVTIQVPHIPAARKYFVVVSVTDPDNGAVIGHACRENIDVRKGATRDVPIILQASSQRDEE